MKLTVARRTIAITLSLFGTGLTTGPSATAEPDAASQPGPVADAPADSALPSTEACKQFSVALNYAAANYEDFAYNTAGGGNVVNYADPSVQSSNVVGRTALREAASAAMDASMTRGLPGNIASPMQQWSLHATKLLLIMGIHGGGDSLNSTATAMNADAHDAQMACALAGTPA